MSRCVLALLLLALPVEAQTPRAPISAAEARRLEAALQANPNDRPARETLLEYYFRAAPPTEAIPARRRLIVWMIQNTPADPLAGAPSATIDAAGHKLADPVGFATASTAWKTQTAKPNASAQTLGNAAYFFKLSDLGLAQTLLERAVELEPANKEIGARLGDLYAQGILGITMVNGNGYPLAASAAQAQGALGQRSRAALNNSRNPYVLAKGAYMLSFQGAILKGTGNLALDPGPIAEAAAQRALSLAPGDQEVAAAVREQRNLQSVSRGR